ncbi:hypothetical protein DSO57_1004078 [Entomophthora muscae]|uniref:Uncharacterized protein n=1 Tax=Entomophthora muscae TaxID=34485 RepID=A0ACC2SX61_9FUNG|nr:hypothetical protein DSO57_1004078 [Entomophthora muscae]
MEHVTPLWPGGFPIYYINHTFPLGQGTTDTCRQEQLAEWHLVLGGGYNLLQIPFQKADDDGVGHNEDMLAHYGFHLIPVLSVEPNWAGVFLTGIVAALGALFCIIAAEDVPICHHVCPTLYTHDWELFGLGKGT